MSFCTSLIWWCELLRCSVCTRTHTDSDEGKTLISRAQLWVSAADPPENCSIDPVEIWLHCRFSPQRPVLHFCSLQTARIKTGGREPNKTRKCEREMMRQMHKTAFYYSTNLKGFIWNEVFCTACFLYKAPL